MTCSIYEADIIIKRRKLVGSILHHTHMNEWLRTNGDPSSIYEVWKNNNSLHSRWYIKAGRWNKMFIPYDTNIVEAYSE